MSHPYFNFSFGSVAEISDETGIPQRTLRDAKAAGRLYWTPAEEGSISYQIRRDDNLRDLLIERGDPLPSSTGTPEFSTPTATEYEGILSVLTADEREELEARFSTRAKQATPKQAAPEPEEVQGGGMIYEDQYTVNYDTDQYIFFLKSYPAAPYPLPIEAVKRIVRAYSDDDGVRVTINEIALSEGLPPDVIEEILKILDKKHASDMFTPEELFDEDVDALTDHAMARKRAAYKQKLQQKSWRETKKDAEKWRQLEESLKASYAHMEGVAQTYEVPRLKPLPGRPETGVVLNLQDLHWPKMGVSGEGSLAEYEAQLMGCLDRLLQSVHDQSSPERVFLTLGGDLFHADNAQGTTTRGTPQHMLTLPSRMYETGCELVVKMIDKCRQLAPVDLVYVRGNHDSLLSYSAYMHARAWFKDVEDVVVPDNSYPRQYRVYGQHLLAFTHGDMNKTQAKEIELKISQEARNLFAMTASTTVFTGHLHHAALYLDRSGTMRYQAPSPSPDDEWHAVSGYTGSRKGLQAVIVLPDRHGDRIINEPI